MSENTTTTTVEPTNAQKPKRAKKETTTVTSLARQRAKQRNIDEGRAAKEVRGKLRANFDALTKAAPSLYGPKGSCKRNANDGARWGAIPASVARDLFKTTAK